jgi:putative tricarboxylic transport membrane protein
MYGYQVGPIILGMILGPLMDRSYRQAMISAEGQPLQFATEFFTSPLSLAILLALTLTLFSQTPLWKCMSVLRRRH